MNNSKINQLYELLKDELEYIVKRIKKRPQTTKNNYGDYLNQLTELHNITNLKYEILAKLLILSGGNAKGINSAMQIINL
tara:strand:+ start:87 stop:326 length:240 start_codon:yes stop_codon:yes gene_type:complete